MATTTLNRERACGTAAPRRAAPAGASREKRCRCPAIGVASTSLDHASAAPSVTMYRLSAASPCSDSCARARRALSNKISSQIQIQIQLCVREGNRVPHGKGRCPLLA